LAEILDERLKVFNDRIDKESLLHNQFFADNETTRLAVLTDQADRKRAREAMLSVGKGTALKSIYSMMEGRPTFNANNLSIFAVKDELSSVSTVLVRNKVATLPSQWVRGKRYVMRTLRVKGAPATHLDFHLLYEETGAIFDVKGSLGREGSYFPLVMNRLSTVTDTVTINTVEEETLITPADADGIPRYTQKVKRESADLKIATFRSVFPDEAWGDEAVVEVGIVGGAASPDGARIRGWAIVSA
jgi:hypothetical protein